MRSKLVGWLLLAGVGLTGHLVAAPGSIVQNGNFSEGPAPGTTLKPGDELNGWTVIRGTLDYLVVQGRGFVALKSGGVQQVLHTVPGRQYEVTANIYGVHHGFIVLVAGDAQTRLDPTAGGNNAIRTWAFVATRSETPLQLYVAAPTEISINSVSVVPIDPAAVARRDLAGEYGVLDRFLYAHHVDGWLADAAPGFTIRQSDGTVRSRTDVSADLAALVAKPHFLVRTAVQDVSADGPNFDATVEETVDYQSPPDQPHHAYRVVTHYRDVWSRAGTRWVLHSRAILSTRSTVDGNEGGPAS